MFHVKSRARKADPVYTDNYECEESTARRHIASEHLGQHCGNGILCFWGKEIIHRQVAWDVVRRCGN